MGRPELRQQGSGVLLDSQFHQTVVNAANVIGSSDVPGFSHNYVLHETHASNPTSVAEVYFGRNYGDTATGTLYPSDPPAFTSQVLQDGMSKSFMTLNNALYASQ